MTLLSFTVEWLGEVVASLLFFQVFLLLAYGLTLVLYGATNRWAWTLGRMTEPFVRPFRRLLVRVRPGFDAAPFLAAVVLYVIEEGVIHGTRRLALVIDPWRPPPDPRIWPFVIVTRAVLWAYLLVVLVRVLVTWSGSSQQHPFVRALARMTDPPLRALRRLFGRGYGATDWSALVLIASLWFLDRVVLEAILRL